MNSYSVFRWALLWIFTTTNLIRIPIHVFMVVASLFYNDGDQTRLGRVTPPFHFKLCFRIVTRGDYPDLVHSNVSGLLALLEHSPIDDFVIQVVCNKSVGLDQVVRHDKVKELPVPDHYFTKSKTKFKARNLQYALDFGSDGLAETDWLVHLDEESQLTPSALTGILAFIQGGKHPIGNS